MAQLLSVSILVPSHAVSADETQQLVASMLGERSARRVRRIVDASRIQTRHSVLPLSELAQLRGVHQRSQAYARHAVALGEQAARDALDKAHMRPGEIDTVVCVSSTGFMVPSLDTYLINQLGLHSTCRRIPMTQLGCAGGVSALGVAAERISGGTSKSALVVAVELPSLWLPVAEPSPFDVLASIQFGDGAAAAVLSGQEMRSQAEIVATRSILFPDSTGGGGIELTDAGLRPAPSAGLPGLVRTSLTDAVAEFLHERGLGFGDVGFWAVHPRSPQLLEAVAESLTLSERELQSSWAVWCRHGNMISASIFFVLRHLQQTVSPRDGTLGLMLALGAGVACEMVLIRRR